MIEPVNGMVMAKIKSAMAKLQNSIKVLVDRKLREHIMMKITAPLAMIPNPAIIKLIIPCIMKWIGRGVDILWPGDCDDSDIFVNISAALIYDLFYFN